MSREAVEKVIHDALEDSIDSTAQLAGVVDDVVNAIFNATGGDAHYVNADEGGFTMQHPISERFEDQVLWDCQYFPLARIAAAQGAFTKHTQHRIWLERGALMWEEV